MTVWKYFLEMLDNFVSMSNSFCFSHCANMSVAVRKSEHRDRASRWEMPAVSDEIKFGGIVMRSILHGAEASIRLNSSAMNKSGKKPNER
jgi:hypothetical protein